VNDDGSIDFEENAISQGFRNSIRVSNEPEISIDWGQWAEPAGLPINVLKERPEYTINIA